MKTLSQADLSNYTFKGRKTFTGNPFVEPFKTMNRGESFLVTKEEWPFKSHPSSVLYHSVKKLGMKLNIKTLADDSGWVVTRVK